jgi:hypothetical protein
MRFRGQADARAFLLEEARQQEARRMGQHRARLDRDRRYTSHCRGNSEARADAIREKIEMALGEGVRYRASEIQSPERMLADLRAAGGARGGSAPEEYERLAERPEVREKLSELMAAHWEHWVDEPLPILGNRTPLDAVKDPDGREIVESLVIQGERFSRNPTSSTDEDVFRRLRERLGLAESRNQSTRGSSTRS